MNFKLNKILFKANFKNSENFQLKNKITLNFKIQFYQKKTLHPNTIHSISILCKRYSYTKFYFKNFMHFNLLWTKSSKLIFNNFGFKKNTHEKSHQIW